MADQEAGNVSQDTPSAEEPTVDQLKATIAKLSGDVKTAQESETAAKKSYGTLQKTHSRLQKQSGDSNPTSTLAALTDALTKSGSIDAEHSGPLNSALRTADNENLVREVHNKTVDEIDKMLSKSGVEFSDAEFAAVEGLLTGQDFSKARGFVQDLVLERLTKAPVASKDVAEEDDGESVVDRAVRAALQAAGVVARPDLGGDAVPAGAPGKFARKDAKDLIQHTGQPTPEFLAGLAAQVKKYYKE